MEQRGEQSARAAQVAKLDSDAGVSSVTRSPTQISGSPGNRTLNLRIKSLLESIPSTCDFAPNAPLTCPFDSWTFMGVHCCLAAQWRPKGTE